MPASDSVAVALYARISKDRLGTEAGVQRQLEDGRRLAELRGWQVYGEYVDNDRSAFNGNVRPEYDRLIEDITAGHVSKVVAYHQSRLWRDRAQRAPAINRLGKLGVTLELLSGGTVDLSTAAGRYFASMVGEGDTNESEIKSERIRRSQQQLAEQGRPNGRVPFGWRRVYDFDSKGHRIGARDVVDEHQAAVVNELVDALLEGVPYKSLIERLENRGEPTPTGRGKWQAITIRSLATRPANIAQRIYKGKVIGDAAWEPIVPVAKHERLVALLADRAESWRGLRPARQRRLLTGAAIGTCGKCGAALSTIRAAYHCSAHGCASRLMTQVDAEVVDRVLAHFLHPDIAELLMPQQSEDVGLLRDRVAALRLRLDQAAEACAAGDIDVKQLAVMSRELRPQLEAAEADVAKALGTISPDIDPAMFTIEARKHWDSLDVPRKRAILRGAGIKVRLMPSGRGTNFNPASIEVTANGAVILGGVQPAATGTLEVQRIERGASTSPTRKLG